MRNRVRATRGYLAGFGTSGSLLAGAAVLFVVGSAFVAFRGWPQIATGPATTAVAAAQPAVPTRVGRRLAAVLSGRRAGGLTSRTRVVGHRRSARGAGGVAGGTAPSSVGGPGGSASGRGSAASVAAPCAGSCGQQASQNLVARLTGAVAQEVSIIGADAGSQVQAASGSAAGIVGGTSPQAGSAVQTVGDGAGSTVSGSAGAAGSAVAQAGNAPGGGGH